MAVVVLIIYIKDKMINFKVSIPIIIFGVVFSILGSFLANSINTLTLKLLFGIFLVSLGLFQGASLFIFEKK